jgi:hypothetical protein
MVGFKGKSNVKMGAAANEYELLILLLIVQLKQEFQFNGVSPYLGFDPLHIPLICGTRSQRLDSF